MTTAAATVRSTQPHWRYAIGILIVNAIAVGFFELLRPADLTYDGLWNARTAVWTVILLIDNILAVWWYSLMTRHHVSVGEQQLELATRQFQDEWRSRRQQLKPIVFTDYDRTTSKHVIRNVGGGFAINVYGVIPEGVDDAPGIYVLGSLAAGSALPLEDAMDSLATDDKAHMLLAEGTFTRTAQWNPTLNALNHWGNISHEIAVADDGKTILEHRTLQAYLDKNWQVLRQQLKKFASEVNPS